MHENISCVCDIESRINFIVCYIYYLLLIKYVELLYIELLIK